MEKKKDNELVIMIRYFVIGVGFFLYSQIKSILGLYLVQGLIGFGEAIYASAFDAVFSKHIEKRKRGRAWARWEALNYFTGALGAFLGGFIVSWFGFKIIYFI